jgi:hypothetical protein
MSKGELLNYAKKVMNERPDLKEEIIDLWTLYLDEVEEGGSPDHEADLCYGSIEELAQPF